MRGCNEGAEAGNRSRDDGIGKLDLGPDRGIFGVESWVGRAKIWGEVMEALDGGNDDARVRVRGCGDWKLLHLHDAESKG